jgi:hypothetical protein
MLRLLTSKSRRRTFIFNKPARLIANERAFYFLFAASAFRFGCRLAAVWLQPGCRLPSGSWSSSLIEARLQTNFADVSQTAQNFSAFVFGSYFRFTL